MQIRPVGNGVIGAYELGETSQLSAKSTPPNPGRRGRGRRRVRGRLPVNAPGVAAPSIAITLAPDHEDPA
jgi:hypothetical protein